MIHSSQQPQVKEPEEGYCAVAQKLEKKPDFLLVWGGGGCFFFLMFRSKGHQVIQSMCLHREQD